MKLARILAFAALTVVVLAEPATAMKSCCASDVACLDLRAGAPKPEPKDSSAPDASCCITDCLACARACGGIPSSRSELPHASVPAGEQFVADVVRPLSTLFEPDLPPPRA